MSTFDSDAVWSATSLAGDEKKIGAAGLSVRQRKLLSLLSQPASIPQLSQSIALPIEDVKIALERFAKLGLAQSSNTMPISPMQTQLRGSTAVAAPSLIPMFVGVAVAVMAAVSLGAWLLRGHNPGASITPAAGNGSKTAPPTAVGPGDTADSALPAPAARTLAAPREPTASAASATSAAAARPIVAPAPVATVVALAVATKAAAAAQVAPTATAPTVAPTVNPLAALALLPATSPQATVAAPSAVAPTVVAPAAVAPVAQVAAAAATSTPAASPPAVVAARPAAAREIKLVNRVEPTFPRGFDADKGTVRARLQVNAQGAVTGVDIVEANPPRIFDRTVRTALQQWRYEPTGEAFSVIAEINFIR